MINMTLAKRMNLTEEQIAIVEHLQLMRRGLNSLAREYATSIEEALQVKAEVPNILYEDFVRRRDAQLRTIYASWVRNEFDLQKAWGFPLRAAYHRFWEFPGCTCPTMDNRDSYPHMQYHSSTCLLHGNSDLTQVAE